jgi:uncharacterized protein YdiU (UPF0061 family)
VEFASPAADELPLDREERNFIRSPVRHAIYSRVDPTPVEGPRLVALSASALGLLGIDAARAAQDAEFLAVMSGCSIPAGARPLAHCYAGFQFGTFAGQLGDGAVIALGEVRGPDGVPQEVQLKGAGQTPYSRQGDGRKVLRSSVREFLASEHMHALGIPTTRASCVVTSDSTTARDMFYSGEVVQERCSLVCRVAPSFLRFGSFEIFKGPDPSSGLSGPSRDDEALRRQLFDYACRRLYPAIWSAAADAAATPASSSSDEASLRAWRVERVFQAVCERTAGMVAGWWMVGHTNGVSNTDNCSILGLSMDYGPFGFMDRFHRDFISNTSDSEGRYSFENQPKAMRWNLEKLAESFAPLLPPADPSAASTPLTLLTDIVADVFDSRLRDCMLRGARGKLGLRGGSTVADVAHTGWDPAVRGSEGAAGGEVVGGAGDAASDMALYEDLLTIMEQTGADFTNTFRALMRVDAGRGEDGDEWFEDVWKGIAPQLSSAADLARAVEPSLSRVQIASLITLIHEMDEAAGASESGKSESGKSESSESQSASSSSASSSAPPYSSSASFVGLVSRTTLEAIAPLLRARMERMPMGRGELSLTRAMMAAHEELRVLVREGAQAIERYVRLVEMPEATKRARDQALWREWLQRYRDRLRLDIAALFGGDADAANAARRELMRFSNPRFVLRNYIAQVAIARAEDLDFSEVQRVLRRLQDPYDAHDADAPRTFSLAAIREQTSSRVLARGARRVRIDVPDSISLASDRVPVDLDADADASIPPGASAVAVRLDARPPAWSTTLRVSCSS